MGWIKNRIDSEYKKHNNLDWSLLAEKKILATIKSELKTPKCIECGEPMINTIDSITGKISKYLWKTNCPHAKNLRLSIG